MFLLFEIISHHNVFQCAVCMWIFPLFFSLVKSSGEILSSDYSHIVVLPDLHGDAAATLRSIWLAHAKIFQKEIPYPIFEDVFYEGLNEGEESENLIDFGDDSLRVALVQLGDLIDRGPYSEDCIRIIFAVKRILGWDVIPLYGNHEIMAFLGEGNEYVHQVDNLIYGSPEKREAAFSAEKNGTLFHLMTSEMVGLARLDGPPGTSTLFVHGGIDLDWFVNENILDPASSCTVDCINEKIHDLIHDPDGIHVLNDIYGGSFLWTRRLARESTSVLCSSLIDPILETFNVSRIVVGHTPQLDKMVKTRCDGKVILADVQISRWMTNARVNERLQEGGRPMALVFNINRESHALDSITSHYTDLKSGKWSQTQELYRKPISVPKFDKLLVLARVASDELTMVSPTVNMEDEDEFEEVPTQPPLKRKRRSSAGKPPLAPRNFQTIPFLNFSNLRGSDD
jgi:hypothetical protein